MLQTALLIAFFILSTFGKSHAQEFSKSVVYLIERSNYGTGFFVKGSGYYLVTAEHVARKLTARSSATVQGQDGAAVNFTLADLTGRSVTTDWEIHDEADVAALRVKPEGKVWDVFKTRFLRLEWFHSLLASPIRERSVTVMGFPLQLGIQGYFSPITSEAKPASNLLRLYSKEMEKEATFFVLDKPSVGGFSGGPAYLLPTAYSKGGGITVLGTNEPPLFVGLVHGTVSDKNGNGLALIVPSKFIVDVIRKADAKNGTFKNE